jgi:peptidoglycan/xylan/chitin deacetylase (PgdA/CDA1 family)
MFNRLKFRHLFAKFVYIFRLAPVFWRQNDDFLSIVNYHYFSNEPTEGDDLEVSFQTIEQQIRTLKDEYSLLPCVPGLDSLFMQQGGELRTPVVILTIDDADCNILQLVPILEKYQVPITIFVPVGFCLDGESLDGLRSRCLHFGIFNLLNKAEGHERYNLENCFNEVMGLNIDQLKELLDKMLIEAGSGQDPLTERKLLNVKDLEEISRHELVTLASHSMSHVRLALLPDKWLKWEIGQSIDYIKGWGGEGEVFSYPYGNKGSFNGDTQKVLEEKGVKYAFASLANNSVANTLPYAIGRSILFNSADKKYVLGTAGGAFELFDRILGRT